jgi:hypothetical protein
MSLTPLKVNTMGSLLGNTGLNINPDAATYMGTSTSLSTYTPGLAVSTTVLDKLTRSIRLAYTKIGTGFADVSQSTYNRLISIGSTTIPALGNSLPSTYTNTYTGETTSYGFLRLIALQAYREFHVNNGSYTDFLSTFRMCHSKKSQLNQTITSLHNSKTFLDGAYSNMNDLVSADITGINLSTFYWGQDLIRSGRAIDLQNIDQFGQPDVLLRTLKANRAIGRPLNIALLSAGINGTDLELLTNGQPATDEQQRLLYAAFSLIMDNDLKDTLIPLNCQTPDLTSLADLLDPKKLFPNSYMSLSYPQYNAITLPTNSKTYYLLYTNGTVNSRPDSGLGERLMNILPDDIAFAADAFSMAMQQIRNIQTMNIEKFSQVVMNLENVNGLTVGGTNVPVNSSLADVALNSIAKGSGTNNLYTMLDYFGSMTSLHYEWRDIQTRIQALQTSNLIGIYNSIYTSLSGPGPYTDLDTLITNANTEISNILASKPVAAQLLIDEYNTFGTHLKKEQDARNLALPGLSDLTSNETDVISFIDSLDQYALETEFAGASLTLENIANITIPGGNFLVASMREARNAKRLGLTGAELDNDVNGTASLQLPRITGSTLANSPIPGYNNSSKLQDVPIVTGAATTLGSLAGSPETMLIPDNLSILVQPAANTVLTPDEAILDVTLCNCDCWDNIDD